VRPTNAAFTYDTTNTLDIELLYDQLGDPAQNAMPTLKLLLANMKTEELGPSMEFGWPLITKYYSPTIAKKNMRFDAPDIDNITRSKWEPAMMANSAGDNVVDMALYSNSKRRFINHVNTKVASMHKGYTEMFNHALFSNWNESIATGAVDITAALVAGGDPVPPQGTGADDALTLERVLAHTDRMLSMPMLIRETVTGHTVGNIATTTTTNGFWQPTVTNASGATVTLSDGGVTAGNASNTDVVTAVANPDALTMDDIYTHLDQYQLGGDYQNYAAVPRAIYQQLRSFLTAITQRDIGSPLGELGIRASIEIEEYNTIFYLEPEMNYLWPNSIFFWNPDTLFLMADSRFNPAGGSGIKTWQEIPGTTNFVTWMLHICQMVCTDMRQQSAMHGYTSG